MDSQLVHLRSVVTLDANLLAVLKEVNPDFEFDGIRRVRIVGNTITIGTAQTRGYEFLVVGDTINGPGTVELRLANHTAKQERNGIAGHRLTVVARRLLGGGMVTRGQQGGKGKKGRDGVQLPPIPQPDPEPPFPQGPPPQIGRNGEDGGKGFTGGPGGPVTLVLGSPSGVTGQYRGVGGFRGQGGDPGVGEDVPGRGVDGDPGQPGPKGELGPDVAAAVSVLDPAGFRAAIAFHLVGGPAADWVRLRQALAEETYRRGDVPGALAELDAVQAMVTFEPAVSDALPSVVRDHLTLNGAAVDQELVPDAAFHAEEYRRVALDLRLALMVDGSLLTSGAADLTTLATTIKQRLAAAAAPGGTLTTQTSDLNTVAKIALETVRVLRPRSVSARKRLDTLLADHPEISPLVKISGFEASAVSVATALATVLGALDPAAAMPDPKITSLIPPVPGEPAFTPRQDAITLLPRNLDLLVSRALRNRRDLPASELSKIRQQALGLAGLAQWGKVAAQGSHPDGTPVAVDLVRVAGDLRGAVGDPAVLDILVELAELSHSWRLGRARIEQAQAGLAVLDLRRRVVERERDRFIPTNPNPARLLPGLRRLLDLIAWEAERADRATQLLTLGLTQSAKPKLPAYPAKPGPEVAAADRLPLLYSPDFALDLLETAAPPVTAGELDQSVAATTTRQPAAAYDTYLARGISLRDADPPYHEVTFTRATHPALFERFDAVGNFWFDVSLDDLRGPLGNPQVEARVAGARVVMTFTGDAPADGLAMLVRHSGLSVQRDLAGGLHRQTLLPADIDVSLGVPVVAGARATGELTGTTLRTVGHEIDFAAYGRGAAAGWLVAKADPTTELPGLDTVSVRIYHETLVPKGTVSLRSVDYAGGALRVGSEVGIRVRLTAPAGPQGAKVQLTSSDPAVLPLPGSVTVPPGATETTITVTVAGPTGRLSPVLSARTADGVTRTVRPIVPRPSAGTTGSVRSNRLSPQAGTIAALALVPGSVFGGKGSAEVLATLSPPRQEPGVPEAPSRVLGRAASDLGARREATVGHQPRSIAVDATRKRIYVVNGGDRSFSVAMLDAGTLKTLAEQRVGLGVRTVTVDPTVGLVYVIGQDRILVFSADDLSLRETITDDKGRLRGPTDIAVVPGTLGRGVLYLPRLVRGVPDEEAALTMIVRNSTGQHRIQSSVDLGDPGLQPVAVAVDSASRLVFVAGLGGGSVAPQVIVFREGGLVERGRIRIPSPVRAIATRPGSGLAYAVGENGLFVVDGTTLTLASRTPLGGFPMAVAVDPATGSAYVGRRDDATLLRVDAPLSAGTVAW